MLLLRLEFKLIRKLVESAEDCTSQCVSPDVGCPEGYKFTNFVPSGANNTIAVGVFCKPDDYQPESFFECFFDADNNYDLTINARVPNIIRRHNWDDREMSLITKSQFDQQPENQPVQIFDSRNTTTSTHW